MALYAIADLHLSLGTNKSMSVFSGWRDYVSKIKHNWEHVVNEDDTVVIAGDISWAMSLKEAKNDFDFINKLPGKKVFVKGNHDYWWSTRSKVEKFLSENLFDTINIIFNSVIPIGDLCICGTKGWLDDITGESNLKLRKREAMRLKVSIEQAKSINKKPIVFLHYPPIYCGNECSEIIDVLIKEQVDMCYYGHIHSKNAHKKALNGVYKGIRMQLISCDYLNFIPYRVV